MASINYDGKKVNECVSDLTKLDGDFNSIASSLKEGLAQVISARGFDEYIGGIDSNYFEQYVEYGRNSVNSIIQEIRNAQIQILSFSQDEEEIDAFLDSLDRKDYKILDLSPIEDHISLGRKASNFFKGIGSSIFTAGAGAVEGILDLGETGADLIALGGTSVASIFTKGYDLFTGSDSTDKMWEQTKAFVSKKHVESIFNSFYDNTKIGQEIKNNAYGFENVRGISKGLGYTAGIIGINVLTGGLASGASIASQGTVSVSQLAMTAGVMGFSNGTEEAWSDGATTKEGIMYGGATGLWEGAQWALGAKIGQAGGLGDKVAKKIFGTAATAAKASATRVALDTVDSAAEGFVQPALKMIYKDYGEKGKEESIIDKYGKAFEENGGWGNVGIQAAIGAIGSAIGEVTDARKILKNSDKNNDLNPETLEKLSTIDSDDSSKKIFLSTLTDDEELELSAGPDLSKPLGLEDIDKILGDDTLNVEILDSPNTEIETLVSKTKAKYSKDDAHYYVVGQEMAPLPDAEIKKRVQSLAQYAEENKDKYSYSIRKQAAKLKTTTGELKEVMTEKLKNFVETSEFGRRTSSDTVELCLDCGYIKNQFETGISQGYIDMGDYKSITRAESEKKVFNIPYDTSYSDRPIYGMLLPSEESELAKYIKSGPGTGYGTGPDKCVIIFNKEAIKDYTTITAGDSLNYDNSLCATPASNPEFHGMFDEYQDAFENVSSLEEVKSLKLADMFNGDEYLEFQIHGTSAHAMNSQNIKEIIFSKEPSESLVKKLNAKNIKYRVI